jgi:hypothetical protein
MDGDSWRGRAYGNEPARGFLVAKVLLRGIDRERTLEAMVQKTDGLTTLVMRNNLIGRYGLIEIHGSPRVP